ncbi:NAD-dependent epimerase/dehydratase family protein [Paenibacillus sp. SYP-B3998]|uniref:NAD-dependent epimerase/dehydratase family protein n=1 Tax=Paenibacillus sp. SYP-B3998 TaxID=2678564 RepID=A0A6G3ZU55_9BACL|nr:NAD-dependent epimerase/dehydratase family protein [Paenibacillus sp. SYP-B3998]NEW05746.1 NAD-dependent epimerase/dehydratase family protein [Paenibacillus sp. SYP-B3998]
MKALVTGGTGFLGKRLAYRLRDLGWEVTVIGRKDLVGKQLAAQGIRYVSLDLRHREEVIKVCKDQEAVFHCAARSASWGAYSDFYDSNVKGTEHVIAGCLRHGVERLIHVSSPSVCFRYTNRLGVTESDALPKKQASPYAATKRLAELAIEKAGAEGLRALIIRPRAIFGPGDTSILPRIIEANATRGVPMIDGGRALIDLTYIDNVVDALLLCQCAPEQVLGRTFHITNGEPMPFVKAAELLFSKLGMSLHTKKLSFPAAFAAASVLEGLATWSASQQEPMLTRAVVGMLGRSQTLDIRAAQLELGYSAKVSIDTGLNAFATWWRNEHA